MGLGFDVAFSGGDTSYLGQNSAITVSATKNNRWLHPEEIKAIEHYVEKSGVTCADVGAEAGCDVTQVLGQQALHRVDAVWNAEFAENAKAQVVLDAIAAAYGKDTIADFGNQIKFLDRDDYYDHTETYSQFVRNDNRIYSPDGTATRFTYNQEDYEDFCQTTFKDWNPDGWTVAGDRLSSAMNFAYDRKVGGDYHDIANYDPMAETTDIFDLQGYMSVGRTLEGEGAFNGTTITNMNEYSYSGQQAFEAVMDIERNTFNGTPPSAEEFMEMFGVNDLADLRGVARYDEVTGEPLGPMSVDGWNLMIAAGDKYHCEEAGRTSDDCFKFVNTQTGQEAVFYDPTPNDGVTEYKLDETSTSGYTFNYDTGYIGVSKHGDWDVDLFKNYSLPYSQQNNGAPLPIAEQDQRSNFDNVTVPYVSDSQ